MKSFSRPIFLIVGMILTACTSCTYQQQSKGIVIDATINTVTLVTEDNDTMSFRIIGADAKNIDGLLSGDTIQVWFKGNYHEGMTADKIVSHPITDNKGTTIKEDYIDNLGNLERRTYRGRLPAASGSGITYSLTVSSREHSGDGVFNLTLNYEGADDGKDKSFEYSGRRYTQRGIPGDDDATVWQCVSVGKNESFNFLRINDSTILLLNSKFEKPQGEQNYHLYLQGD